MIRIAIIAGSTRPKRFSDKPAQWLLEEAKKRDEVDAELLDLRDWPLPFYDEAGTPTSLKGDYSHEIAKKWAAKIGEVDAFILVTPEYNHGPSAVLKNALDYVYDEWNNKPVAFMSYGGMGGARAVEQLRQVAVALQMAPMQSAIHIPGAKFFPLASGQEEWNPTQDESLQRNSEKLFDQLLWWAKALKAAREQ